MNEEQELMNELERPPEIPSANEINLQRAEERDIKKIGKKLHEVYNEVMKNS